VGLTLARTPLGGRRRRAVGSDERRVTRAIAARLSLGAATYGPLDIAGDPRDWTHEALEEALDLAVYLAAALLRARSTRRSLMTEKFLFSGVRRGRKGAP
jgi:hypothetical protein